MSANATFCATLVDEWVVRGLEHAVIAPGSRSTPLALALRADDRVTCHTVLDERSAAFVALGLAADGGVSLVLCTSGTAAVNLHPAVVEAGLSDLAVLVCTADRPPELRGVGAPQTIDQVDLFGPAVRWSVDAPVPDDSDPAGWRELARRCIDTASGLRGGRPGPVQVNLPFREPLVGPAGPLPVSGPATEGAAPVGRAPEEVPDGLLEGRGLVIVGGRHGCESADILRCA
ncbi:MAG: thiamine pyrophosphate-binding protein, partial [Ilumatobacter sp.]